METAQRRASGEPAATAGSPADPRGAYGTYETHEAASTVVPGAAQQPPAGVTEAGAPPPPPLLRHRRDSLLPATAAALSVRGETSTHAGDKPDRQPPLHPLVDEFLAALPVSQRERFTGRCPETVLLSQFLTEAQAARPKRHADKPFREHDARKALRGARMTTVRIREVGDPEHGTHQPPCRSCASLLEHFGVKAVTVKPTKSSRKQHG
ncbi:YwqJ-related putative deaminase [Phaeacidiphilus oryzae]|uniref:YwqJ-related putative deaminase n=1 Tax=Phaeacidiphilus oryzae TaxID=348818 RepID=UPI00068EBDB9|nr:YwqJ-related putative deaminase [Phaeacidiphilus oryzae]